MADFGDMDYEKANTLLVLRDLGHVNVKEFIDICKIGLYPEPEATYVTYINGEGKERTDPIDADLSEITLLRDALTQEQEQAMDEAWGLT